jgi:hypothetical protein
MANSIWEKEENLTSQTESHGAGGYILQTTVEKEKLFNS